MSGSKLKIINKYPFFTKKPTRQSVRKRKILASGNCKRPSNQNNMATFTVVMRCLSKGQTHNLQRCLQQTQLDPRNMTDLLYSGIGSQMHLRSKHFSIDRKCISKALVLEPASYLCTSRSVLDLSPHSILWREKQSPLHILSNSSNFLVRRKFSTSTTEHTASTQTSSDSASDKQESNEKSEKEPKKESWWRGKNSWRLGLIFLGGTFITWGIGLVNIWGKRA